jgi:hypothetical protein
MQRGDATFSPVVFGDGADKDPFNHWRLDFMAAQGMAWPQLADNNQVTRADFGMGVPVTWFVNAKGEVAFKQVGQIHSWTQMRDLISAHLGIKIPS